MNQKFPKPIGPPNRWFCSLCGWLPNDNLRRHNSVMCRIAKWISKVS